MDQERPVAFLCEEEPGEDGRVRAVATLFLANRECPWRCVMCDLWRNTLPDAVPVGAIPRQMDHALERLPVAQRIKLYNSGSFFDLKAIPAEDYEAIAGRVSGFEQVIVECHPKLVGERAVAFRDLTGTHLEVALGLETANPEVLERLNKGMTLADFERAATFLRNHGMGLRVFLLVNPPFVLPEEASDWVRRSVEYAFDAGAGVVSLIPARGGNGAMEALAGEGLFQPPRLEELEAAVEFGIGLKRGRVFGDVWDLERFSDCAGCFGARRNRLRAMNLEQRNLAEIECESCGHGL